MWCSEPCSSESVDPECAALVLMLRDRSSLVESAQCWKSCLITTMIVIGDDDYWLQGHCIRLIGIGISVLPPVQTEPIRGYGPTTTLLLHLLRTPLHISIVLLHDVTTQRLTAKLGSTCQNVEPQMHVAKTSVAHVQSCWLQPPKEGRVAYCTSTQQELQHFRKKQGD